MGYYDRNTVTALLNCAQHYAMSDNFFSTTFDPSTTDVINLVLGHTHEATPVNRASSYNVANGKVTGDPRPTYELL
ncbi:MAG: alkaline phosphatase family protein [Nitrososphaeraceae archaeon]